MIINKIFYDFLKVMQLIYTLIRIFQNQIKKLN